MSKFAVWCAAVLTLVLANAGRMLRANPNDAILAVVMTNDASANAIKVYDAQTKTELQTLSTRGQGGVGGNARGVRQFRGELVAAVNNGSNSGAIYPRDGTGLKFDQLVPTTSPPVSVDFGNNHLYVAGSTTIDSFALNGNH